MLVRIYAFVFVSTLLVALTVSFMTRTMASTPFFVVHNIVLFYLRNDAHK
jgi:hypothetical protein